MNLDDLKTLIDKASQICGSNGKLAKELKVSPTLVNDWKHGRKRCAPEDIALIAEQAGLDAEKWLQRGTLWKWEGTPKGERLLHALGKGLAATGAAIASSSTSAGIADSVVGLIRCIGSQAKSAIPALFFRPINTVLSST